MEFTDVLKKDIPKINSLIEKSIPRNLENWMDNIFKKSEWEYDIEACNNSISKPIWDLLDRGGKRWRPFLMKLSYHATGGHKNIDKFLPIPEIIHNGTLMIDDIEDSSETRRGGPCIHKIYGEDIAINAGNAMYYLPTISIIKDDTLDIETKNKIYELINEEMIKLSFGQGMDISWHRNEKIPNEKQYLQMCAYKTGTLARMSAKLGAILAGANNEETKALGNFAESIGIAFQIQDDILNIAPGENWGKDFGDDVSEGKKTLLVINALREIDENKKKELTSILNQKTKDKILIEKAIKILKESGAIRYCKNSAKIMVENAWKKLDSTLKESEAKNKLKSLSEFVINREI